MEPTIRQLGSIQLALSARPAWRQPLVVGFIVVACATMVDRWSHIEAHCWWAAGAVGWLAWLVCFCLRADRVAWLLLLIVSFLTAAAWHHGHWSLMAAHDLMTYAGEEPGPVCLRAIVSDEPHRHPAPPADPLRTIPAHDRTELLLAVRSIRDGRGWQPARGRGTLLVSGHLLGVHAGDEVQIFGQLALPGRPKNPGEFDRSAHERADGIHSVVFSDSPDCVRVRERHGPPSLSAWASRWRRAGAMTLQRFLTAPQAGLGAALLLGDQDYLEDRPVEAFFTTGMVHVLVVSGLHVAILAGCLLLPQRLGLMARRPSLLCMVLVVLGYTLVTGARPPATRAATLVCVFALGQFIGRKPLSWNSLAVAALLVWAMNPADLFRVGPQLSFLAVSVLVWIAGWRKPIVPDDPLDRLIYSTRPMAQRVLYRAFGGIKQLLMANALLWALLTPLTSASFHLFSPIALLLTPVMWLPVLGATVSGFLLLVVGGIAPLFAAPIGWVCGFFLDALQAGVDWGQRLPGSYYWVAGPPRWWIAGIYLGFACVLLFPRRVPRTRWVVALLAGWIIVGLAPGLFRSATGDARFTFVAVGHGLGVIVELPGGQTLLYDAGRIGSPHTPARSIAATLWTRGISHLDAVVISHADADHYNALPELLERFTVGVVYVSPMMFERDTPALNKLRTRIRDFEVPMREIWAGDRLSLAANAPRKSGIQLDVLHPPRQGVLGSDNANSIVIEFLYAGRRVLLTGDLESPGLNLVTQEPSAPTDVLLAPHHGSARSDPPGFAAWALPRYLVISGGDERGLDEVRSAYEQVGAKVFHTSRHGAVTAVIRASGALEVSTYR